MDSNLMQNPDGRPSSDKDVQATISRLTNSPCSRPDLAAMHYNRQLAEIRAIVTYMQAFASADVVFNDVSQLLNEVC